MTEAYRAEMVGVPDCEKFEPVPVAVSSPELPFLYPSDTIPEILELKKMERDDSKMQTQMDEIKEAAYIAEPALDRKDDDKEPNASGSTDLVVSPLIEALMSSSTPSAE